MARSYTDIGERSGGDPNVMKLEASTKVRPLDNLVADFKRHVIENPKDESQSQMVVCPGPRTCPLCRKPVDENFEPRFAMSTRFAANVWDYESNSVKVLIGGPQIFDEFKTAAKLGIEPSSCDWTIVREGSGRQTKYSVVRHNADAGPQVTPDQLHDVTKYEAPTSVDSIFDMLEKYGIDYDSLAVPSFSLEQAQRFVMPYTGAKGQTIERFVDTDESKAMWLHGAKLEQGQLGDPVFLALQTVLEDRGLVQPLEDAISALPDQSPVAAPEPTAAPEASESTLPDPGPGEVRLLALNGLPCNIPESSVESLLAAGFTRPEPQPEPQQPDLPDENTPTEVMIGGQKVELPRLQAEKMIAMGAAERIEIEGPKAPSLPLPDEKVLVDINGVEVEMMFAHAEKLVADGAAGFIQQEVAEAYANEQAGKDQREQDKADRDSVAAQAEQETEPSAAVASAVTAQAQETKCPHCGTVCKTAQGLKLHIKGKHPEQEAAPAKPPDDKTEVTTKGSVEAGSAPKATTPAQASANGGPEADANELEKVKDLIARSPFAKDYSTILEIFEIETGKRNIVEMDATELAKVRAAVEAKMAAKA